MRTDWYQQMSYDHKDRFCWLYNDISNTQLHPGSLVFLDQGKFVEFIVKWRPTYQVCKLLSRQFKLIEQ